jgi:hypothetical protein
MDQNKKDILKQLKDSGHGFETPEAYFEKLEHQLKNEVLEETPKLNLVKDRRSQKKTFKRLNNPKAGFTVPDGYFDTLDSDFPVENKKKLFRLAHPGLRILSLSIAASILLFFGIRTLTVSESATDLTEIQNEDIIAWVDSGLIEFESYEIAEAFSDIELEENLMDIEDLSLYFEEIDVENLMIEN